MKKVKKKIYIRADGNAGIGMGHLTRCLSVADALRERGGDACFLAADEETAAIVRKAGFGCEALGTDYRRMEEELPVLERILHRGSGETVRGAFCGGADCRKREGTSPLEEGITGNESCLFLVDSYYVTAAYLRMLRKWGEVAYLDDVNAFPYPVNLIINGNIYGADMDYSSCGADTEIMGGPAYAPLKQQFAAHRGERREAYILVTTGGSDPYCLAGKIVGALLKETWMEEEKICTVCGRFSQSIEALREMEKKEPRLQILSDVPDMWSVMNGAKFAVTAAGGTMQELACLGVPMIGFSFADSQRLAAKTWYEQGYSCYGGDYLSSGDKIVPEICAAVKRLCEDSELRELYSQKLMKLVDGEGSGRVAERLMNSM